MPAKLVQPKLSAKARELLILAIRDNENGLLLHSTCKEQPNAFEELMAAGRLEPARVGDFCGYRVNPVPIEYPEEIDHDEWKSSEVRKNARFQPGDVVLVMKDGVAKIALIKHVWSEQSNVGYFYPRYPIAMVRPNGSFNTTSRRSLVTYPGFIYRAYQKEGKVK